MNRIPSRPAAPVGRQGPPARAAASAGGGTPRRVRVPLSGRRRMDTDDYVELSMKRILDRPVRPHDAQQLLG